MSKITSYYGKRKRGAFGGAYGTYKRRKSFPASRMNQFNAIPSNVGMTSSGMVKTFTNYKAVTLTAAGEITGESFLPTGFHTQNDKNILNVFGSLKLMYVVVELIGVTQGAVGGVQETVSAGMVGIGLSDTRAGPADLSALVNTITNSKIKPAGTFSFSQTNMKVLYKPVLTDEATVMTPETYLGDKRFFNLVLLGPVTTSDKTFHLKVTTKIRCMMV